MFAYLSTPSTASHTLAYALSAAAILRNILCVSLSSNGSLLIVSSFLLRMSLPDSMLSWTGSWHSFQSRQPWYLNMPKMTKFWAYSLMVLGGIGSIVSLVRFAFVKSLEPDVNFFINTGKLAFYSHIEPGLGIAAVCLATLRSLFRQCLDGAKSMSSTQRSHGPSGTKRTSVAGGSGLQLTSMRKSRRVRDEFVTFEDDSDGMQTQWSNENEIGVKTECTVETRPTSSNEEQGQEMFPR